MTNSKVSSLLRLFLSPRKLEHFLRPCIQLFCHLGAKRRDLRFGGGYTISENSVNLLSPRKPNFLSSRQPNFLSPHQLNFLSSRKLIFFPSRQLIFFLSRSAAERSAVRITPTIIIALLTLTTTTKSHAQAAPTATGPGSFLAVGIAASGFQQDYGHHDIGGETLFLDANLYRRIGVEVELRRLNFHTEEDVKENTLLAGVKIATNPHRVRPYVKLLAGRGTLDFPFHYATGSYFVVAPSAGLDYHFHNSRINIRVFDFQYQLWPQFSFGELHPYGLTTGISFDVFRPSFAPSGRRIHLK